MARLSAPPSSAWVRDALIADAEVIEGYMSRTGAGGCSLLLALKSGRAVTVRWWELPDDIKASMPKPLDINEVWILDEADRLRCG